jgi:hypothetical protein
MPKAHRNAMKNEAKVKKMVATQKRQNHPWRKLPGTTSIRGAILSAQFNKRDREKERGQSEGD